MGEQENCTGRAKESEGTVVPAALRGVNSQGRLLLPDLRGDRRKSPLTHITPSRICCYASRFGVSHVFPREVLTESMTNGSGADDMHDAYYFVGLRE